MDANVFDDLEQALTEQGPAAAIDRLCAGLTERKDYANLFYTLLLKKRYELGVSPIPTAPSHELPEEVHGPYEDAIREAGRLVGRLYLEEGDIPRAWGYFRMLGEPQPVAEALEKVQAGEDDDVQQLVDIAYHQGVNPRKGFDLILERFGICSAITAVAGTESVFAPEVRLHCIQRLVRALYQELYERLKHDVLRREGTPVGQLSKAATGQAGSESCPTTVRGLITGRDWLFDDEFYHIDISHLGAVVQMSVHLPPGAELEMARELCEYGRRLSPRFLSPGEPPFEDLYKDHAAYLSALAGQDVDENVAHFRRKAQEADLATVGTRPAEVLVNLLLRLGRAPEALDVARRHLAGVNDRPVSCPTISELCRQTGNYHVLAEVAREQGDPVHFMAGLLAAKQPT